MSAILVQLSDPHVVAPGQLANGRVDSAACLRRAVAAVGALPQRPDAIIVTGDLVEHGSAVEYEQLRALLAPLACPCYLLPGNHDERCALRAAFADRDWMPGAADDFIQFAVSVGGLRLIALDTVVPGETHGELCAQRLRQFERLLAAEPDRPTIVAMHHPPFRTGIQRMDEFGLRSGAPAFEALLSRAPQVRRVICGHLHRSIQCGVAGIVAQTAPSTAHQLALDLALDAALGFTLEPPGMLLHVLLPGAALVTHQLAIGEFAGPFPFGPGD